VFVGVKLLFSAPDLALTFEQTKLSVPNYLFQNLEGAYRLDSMKLSDSMHVAVRNLQEFLRGTRDLTFVTLNNTTSESMENVDLRVKYVFDVHGISVAGSSFSRQESGAVLDNFHHDDAARLLTLSIPRLPPKSSVTLAVWGDVSYNELLFGDQIIATYDGGAGRVVQERTIQGVDAFVYDNSILLIIVVLLVNIAVYLPLLNKLEKSQSSPVAGSPKPVEPPLEQR
jgi:hypothetical protein